ncbi:hypothetical protein ACB092_06G117900 [Castanea dentata]
MSKALTTLLFSCILFSLSVSSYAQTCNSYTFSNKVYALCQDLPVLNAFLHYTYNSSANTLDVAYRVTGATASNWIAWAINPSGQIMAGSQALVAYQNSSGVQAFTSAVTSSGIATPSGSTLSFGVSNLNATFVNNEMIISATLALTSGMTTVNQVWQVGPVSGNNLQSHDTSSSADNMRSVGTLNLLDGTITSGGGAGSKLRRENVHGVLNAVSWGTLMPLGVIIARYLKVFKSADPAWFYLHIACQTSAYVVGVAGWATGMKLGSETSLHNYPHRNIGITLFCLGTLQVFALLLRPKKDHKYRLYWNIYHHSIGYTVIILSIVNVFKGLDLLDPEKKWKKIYTAILIFLGFNAAMLEAFTWYIVIKRKKTGSDKYPSHENGANGTNGYGARAQQGV